VAETHFGPSRSILARLIFATTGSVLALMGALGMSVQRFGVYTMPGFCTGGPCVTVGPHYYPYIPTFIIIVVSVAAVAPLAVALRPSFWWAGVACSLAGVGFPGVVWLLTSVSVPYPVQPFVVFVFSSLLVLGAALTTAGVVSLRLPRTPDRTSTSPSFSSNGTG
jgi:hypothetical protein